MSSQHVQYSISKYSAKCGRWDASFRLLATPSPHWYAKHAKVVFLSDFVDFHGFHVFFVCRQKYSKFSFLYFNVHRGDPISKHLE